MFPKAANGFAKERLTPQATNLMALLDIFCFTLALLRLLLAITFRFSSPFADPSPNSSVTPAFPPESGSDSNPCFGVPLQW